MNWPEMLRLPLPKNAEGSIRENGRWDVQTTDFRSEKQSMFYMITKALLSGIIIMVVSEIAKRSPAFGALVASLPLISLLAIIWLWRDTGDTARIANHAEATFWYVLPSLPMFLVFPVMLRHGMPFWLALLLACTLTVALYGLTMVVVAKFGVRL